MRLLIFHGWALPRALLPGSISSTLLSFLALDLQSTVHQRSLLEVWLWFAMREHLCSSARLIGGVVAVIAGGSLGGGARRWWCQVPLWSPPVGGATTSFGMLIGRFVAHVYGWSRLRAAAR